MKKAILSLCVAVTAALAFIGCNKSSDGGSSGGGEKSHGHYCAFYRVGGVNISDLDGNEFKKVEMPAGKTRYKAETKPKLGYAASVSVETEEIKGKLPTMDEYLEKAMRVEWNLEMPVRPQVQSKTDSTATVSGPRDGGTTILRVFRDEAKNCFVVVRGWYYNGNDAPYKAAVESCVNSAKL